MAGADKLKSANDAAKKRIPTLPTGFEPATARKNRSMAESERDPVALPVPAVPSRLLLLRAEPCQQPLGDREIITGCAPKLYDRTTEEVSREEIQRIRI
jgi:hypothetical protein